MDTRSAVDFELQRYQCKFAVRVIRSRKTGQVLYLEAGKDFIDTLLSFLLLPIGTIIHMLSTGVSEVKHFGSLSSMFKSVEKLDSALLHVDKNYILAQPRPVANNPAGLSEATTATGLLELCLDADATRRQGPPKPKLVLPETFFKCDNCDRLSSKQNDRCYICWPSPDPMWPVRFFNPARRFNMGPYNLCSEDVRRQEICAAEHLKPAEVSTLSTGPGFVTERITFIVTDNLEIMPATITESMRVLNALKVSNLADLECNEMITVTITQVLQLLQSALSSTTCLTDVFSIAESSASTSSIPTDEATVQFQNLRTDSP